MPPRGRPSRSLRDQLARAGAGSRTSASSFGTSTIMGIGGAPAPLGGSGGLRLRRRRRAVLLGAARSTRPRPREDRHPAHLPEHVACRAPAHDAIERRTSLFRSRAARLSGSPGSERRGDARSSSGRAPVSVVDQPSGLPFPLDRLLVRLRTRVGGRFRAPRRWRRLTARALEGACVTPDDGRAAGPTRTRRKGEVRPDSFKNHS